MKKIKVLLFGTRPLSVDICKLIKKSKYFDLIGIVSKRPNKKAWWDKDIYFHKKENFISENKIKKINFDLGISINWEKLIKKEILNLPKYGFINIHNSYLNILRGRNIFFHCISGNKYFRDNFGCTLHSMNEKFDDGKILKSKKIKIEITDTSWDLYKKFNIAAKEIFKRYLGNLDNLEKFKKFKKKKTFYFKKKLNLNKNFSKMEPDINFYNKIRALDFPGFVPPYVKINGKKKYLFIKKNKKRKIFKKLKFKKNNYNIYFSKTY